MQCLVDLSVLRASCVVVLHLLCLKSLAEAFSVPEDFIGDFLCRKGMVDPPIPRDVPLRELADPAAVWNLIEYLQLQDPARIHDM